MDKALLSQLRDVHMPAPIGWWPLAPGWYAVALLLLILCWLGGMTIRRHARQTKAKRQALHLLRLFAKQHQKNPQSARACARISELLRRVAMLYYPRAEVAHLKQQAWLEFLTRTAKNIDFQQFSHELLELPYQQQAPQAEPYALEPLFAAAERWVRQRRGRCLP